jgi:transcriptional regulator with XRE-family HTH domain
MAEKNLAQIFAENLVSFRKKKGISQYDLANQTAISRSMISYYEREGALPPIDRLQSIALALDIPASHLFEDRTTSFDPASDLSDIDPRSVKKLRDILSLSAEDRNDLYRILNKMLRKHQLEEREAATLALSAQPPHISGETEHSAQQQ